MERLDDLQFNGLQLLQKTEGFCFGSDAVELANFVPVATRFSASACDLGAGNGIISVLLAAKKNYTVTAVEIQNSAAQLCEKNIELNGLAGKITVVNAAMQDFCRAENKGVFDVTVCNPPYEPLCKGEQSLVDAVRTARFEEAVTLQEVILTAAHLTKFGGKFYLVHKVERLSEVLRLCSEQLVEPKILQILRPASHKPPHLFLLQCTKNGKTGLRVLPEREIRSHV